MRAKTSLLVPLILACAAWAQTPPASPKAPADKTATAPQAKAAPTKKAAPPQAKTAPMKKAAAPRAKAAPTNKAAAPQAKAAQGKKVAAPQTKPVTKQGAVASKEKSAPTVSKTPAKPTQAKAPAKAAPAAKPAPVSKSKTTPVASKAPATPIKVRVPGKAIPAAKQPAAASKPKTARGAKKASVTKKTTKAAKRVPARIASQPKPKATPVAPAIKPPATTAALPPLRPAVRRDPFISPVVKMGNVQPCTAGGKKCLAIGDIVLKGVAKTDNGMLAMVENSARKAYFLRENDPVFNGVVVKITMDSVVLRETVMDRLGHQSTREVIKKIPTSPVG